MFLYLQNIIKKMKDSYNRRASFLEENGIFSYVSNNRGYVLIIVLIVSSFLITISSQFLLTAQTNINYLKKFRDQTKAEAIADMGIGLGEFILQADKSGAASSILAGVNSNNTTDTYKDIWALPFPEFDVGDGTLKIEIEDEQSKLNISMVAQSFEEGGSFGESTTAYYPILQRFMMNMGFQMDLADTIRDWVDIDENKSAYGAETYDFYSTLPSPYHAKNREMDSIDELLMVKFFTPKVFYGFGGGNKDSEQNLVESNKNIPSMSETMSKEKPELSQKSEAEIKIGKEKSRVLSDYLRVNGKRSDLSDDINKININTASFRLLSALTDDMTDDKVTELIRRRNKKPFDSVDEIKEYIADDTFKRNNLSVKSDLFQIKATARVNNFTVVYRAIYNRQDKVVYYLSIQ